MKHLFLFIAGLLFFTNTQAQTKANDILGIWLNAEKDAKITVYEKGGKYYGKLVWIKKDENPDGTSPKLDNNNPEAQLKKRALMGLVILKDLEFDDDEWEDGTIYDPKSGKTYSCFTKLESPTELYLKGYIGLSFIGRSSIWTKSSL